MRMIVLAALLPLAACGNGDESAGVTPTGTGNARTFAVTDFTAVDLRGPDDIDVRVGAGYSVRAEGDKAALDALKIDRDDGTLRVGRRKFDWGTSGKARIFVTMPRIEGAAVSGSGNLAVDRAEGTKFDGGVAGSGNLKVAAMAVQKAELSIAGSGNIAAAGTARELELSIAGSGNIDAKRVTASQGEASIAGSGDITATINGPAKVSLMGSGDIDLGAGAKCSTDKMGSGTVRCGNDRTCPGRVIGATLRHDPPRPPPPLRASGEPRACRRPYLFGRQLRSRPRRRPLRGPHRDGHVSGREGDRRSCGGRSAEDRGQRYQPRRADGASTAGARSRRAATTKPVVITLRTPRLTTIVVNAGARVTVDRMAAQRLDVAVSGSGALTVAKLEGDQVNAALTGTGTLALAGRAQRAQIALIGSGTIDASRLETSDLVTRLDGTGVLTANARYTARASSSGLGRIEIAGNAKCVVTSTGGGPVRCGTATRP